MPKSIRRWGKPISARLDKITHDKIRKEAKERGWPISELIRHIVEEWIKEKDQMRLRKKKHNGGMEK